MKIDRAHFPIVWMRNDPALAEPLDQVLSDLSSLLSLQKPFVCIAEDAPQRSSSGNDVDERRALAAWVKQNTHSIQQQIRGHVQIVQEAQEREAMEAFSVAFFKFWGYPMYVVADVDAGLAKALSLLTDA
ncbi:MULTISPECIES: hypothetical protein [Stenotrophomonas]|uniref:hypothetical protein n=1 Tax=Stenotrophomonas TaxID=40323 RepID=UPI000D7D6919|nr:MULTISPECIES: hypothetical protein [Stenotrophomonas]AWT14928.1 hypothetical protein DM611_11970 [Stenotrophomonas maltophilia]MBA0286164.1 hypothetical protein [Stenotrophomonas maltophilia]MBA0323476.1 hypothetical protein [Stenotrophomonas maltophilia]MRI42348.1 hypothetical protein [Stenotrophomonas sp. MH181796]HDS1130099.1 hypothetical protein [Stenotrophomonas maltophilia]